MVSKKIIGIIIGIVIIALIFSALYGMYFSGYNSAQIKDEQIKKYAADVDVQLQRRYDLIPNLIQSVKGYMQFEKDVLEQITKLRSQWQTSTNTSEKVELSNQIEQALSKIILTYENYPELKSDTTVTRLMDELAGTENRISVARTYYNDGVRDFNINIRTFPNNVFNQNGFIGLSPWGLEQYPTYEATSVAQTTVPKVDLTVP
ncbi:MAG TPA: LemA family protein [Nitrosarchaeum sp.]|nr:LemA family protein [Nitrosarchaeum sp.]